MPLVYVLQCLRHHDVQLPAHLVQFGQADATVHERFAVWTDRDQISQRLSDRHVIGHASSWRLGCAAANAIHFTRLANPLVFHTTQLKKLRQVPTQDQHWLPVVTDGKAPFDPFPHRVPMDAE